MEKDETHKYQLKLSSFTFFMISRFEFILCIDFVMILVGNKENPIIFYGLFPHVQIEPETTAPESTVDEKEKTSYEENENEENRNEGSEKKFVPKKIVLNFDDDSLELKVNQDDLFEADDTPVKQLLQCSVGFLVIFH